MRTSDIAKLLGVTTATIRGWTINEYKDFLSASARGGSGRTRQFTDQDARMLGLVASLRADGLSHDDIVRTLEVHQADGWTELPPLPAAPPDGSGPVVMIPEHSAQTAMVERERFWGREVAVRDERIQSLEANLEDEQAAHEQTRQVLQETNQTLQEARETVGEQRGKLDATDRERTATEQERARERKLYTYGLIAVAIAAAVLLAAVLWLALQAGAA